MLRLALRAGTLSVCSLFTLASARADSACEQIEDGNLVRPDGQPVVLGPDERGYDYWLHKFEGPYCQTLANPQSCGGYEGVTLTMLWNEAWMSNQDCDGDDLLDRHHGFASYRGSGAKLTNIMLGSVQRNGEPCDWHYVYWIEAAPLDATLSAGVWYRADGSRLGQAIWGEFAIVHTLYQEVCAEDRVREE